MSRPQLHHTLTNLVRALEPEPGAGLRIGEADLAVPLELATETVDGRLVVLGRVPHSRWKAGFLPATSTARIRVVVSEEVDDGG
ncbi:hypothetical protein ACIA5D_42685 [Actinoplanes sp. NPDC051513]|uniref:hypothetical protein n=1 Tax=Actinoplanes sp. NPDC051513 TaxID=3363908 RepID=UPI0037A82FA1